MMLFLAATIVSVSGVFIAGGWSDIDVCSFGKPFIHSFIHLFVHQSWWCVSLIALFLWLISSSLDYKPGIVACLQLRSRRASRALCQQFGSEHDAIKQRNTGNMFSARAGKNREQAQARTRVCVCVQYCIFVTLLIFCCIIFFCAQVVAGMNFFLSFSPNCTDSDIIRYASQTHYNPFFLSLSFFFILSDCSSPRSSFLHCVLPSGKTWPSSAPWTVSTTSRISLVMSNDWSCCFLIVIHFSRLCSKSYLFSLSSNGVISFHWIVFVFHNQPRVHSSSPASSLSLSPFSLSPSPSLSVSVPLAVSCV